MNGTGKALSAVERGVERAFGFTPKPDAKAAASKATVATKTTPEAGPPAPGAATEEEPKKPKPPEKKSGTKGDAAEWDKLEKQVKFYSDDQPRDQYGRWAEGVGEAKAAEGAGIARYPKSEAAQHHDASAYHTRLANDLGRGHAQSDAHRTAARAHAEAARLWEEADKPRGGEVGLARASNVGGFARTASEIAHGKTLSGPEAIDFAGAKAKNFDFYPLTRGFRNLSPGTKAALDANKAHGGGRPIKGWRKNLTGADETDSQKFYSDSQERDEHGRWTGGSADGKAARDASIPREHAKAEGYHRAAAEELRGIGSYDSTEKAAVAHERAAEAHARASDDSPYRRTAQNSREGRGREARGLTAVAHSVTKTALAKVRAHINDADAHRAAEDARGDRNWKGPGRKASDYSANDGTQKLGATMSDVATKAIDAVEAGVRQRFEYDEGKHPRDEHGRWSGGSSEGKAAEEANTKAEHQKAAYYHTDAADAIDTAAIKGDSTSGVRSTRVLSTRKPRRRTFRQRDSRATPGSGSAPETSPPGRTRSRGSWVLMTLTRRSSRQPPSRRASAPSSRRNSTRRTRNEMPRGGGVAAGRSRRQPRPRRRRRSTAPLRDTTPVKRTCSKRSTTGRRPRATRKLPTTTHAPLLPAARRTARA